MVEDLSPIPKNSKSESLLLCGNFSGWSGSSYAQNKVSCRDQPNTLLNVSRMGGDAQERNAAEPFRNNLCNFERVRLLLLASRQDALHGPAHCSWPIATENGCLHRARQVEKVPLRTLDISGQSRAIEIPDDSPARQESITLDRNVLRQRRVVPYEDALAVVHV